MSSISLKHRLAPDVLKNEQKWAEKLVSVAGMLNTRYISPWMQKGGPSSTAASHSVSTPSPTVLYPHVFKLHSARGKAWVFLASADTYSIWKCSHSDKTGAFHTELVASGSDVRIIDGCLYAQPDGECSYYTATNSTEGEAASFSVRKRTVRADGAQEPPAVAAAQFSGEVVSISAVNQYVVLCQVGVLKLLCRDSLHVFVDIPSIPGVPTVFAPSDRWFAVQIAQSNHRISAAESSRPESDFNVAARKIVSGAYTLGKAGWERIGPLVYQLYKHDDAAGHSSESVPAEQAAKAGAGGPVYTGGAVAIFDAVTSGSPDSTALGKEDKLSISLNVVCKFLAHNEDLELLSFSPSGLMVASASVSGQVIHVHSLASSGLLFSSSAKSIAINNRKGPYEQTPQLVYKLVRGLSLATVIHISFDAVESMAAVGTNNGTVHLFDLERRNTSSGLGGTDRVEVSPVSATDINSKSSGGAGSSFTGSEMSSSAGSAPSSAPRSNIDDLLSQFASQKALDAGEDIEGGMKYIKSLIKEVYPSRRVRLPTRDYVPTPEGEEGVKESQTLGPAGISYSKAASVASTVGFTSMSVEMSVLNAKTSNSNRRSKTSSDSHEVYVLSSQGMLCRFRVPIARPVEKVGHTQSTNSRFSASYLSNQMSGGIDGFLNGGGQSNQPRELNRWDLFASLEDSAELNNSSGHVETSRESARNGSRSAGSVSSTPPVNSAAWLYAFGDIRGAAGNGSNPLWTRPQVAYRSRLRQSSGGEKDKSTNGNHSKKQSQGGGATGSAYSFLFPERTASEPLGNSLQAKRELGDLGIMSTISSVLASNGGSDGATHSSGRRVATKHVDAGRHANNDVVRSFEDWEVPTETDWIPEKAPSPEPEGISAAEGEIEEEEEVIDC